MTDKKKEDETDTKKSASPEFKEPAKTNKIPDEKDVSPVDDLKEVIEEKAPEDKTEQEKFVEGQAQLKEYTDAASSGAPAPGGGPTGVNAGLAEKGEKDKEIVPPATAELPEDEDEDFSGLYDEDEDEVPFEPVDDPKARLHGTHDAAMGGLQTDISGTYVPPGLVKQAEDKKAELDNKEREERAREQQRRFATDTGGRRNRL